MNRLCTRCNTFRRCVLTGNNYLDKSNSRWSRIDGTLVCPKCTATLKYAKKKKPKKVELLGPKLALLSHRRCASCNTQLGFDRWKWCATCYTLPADPLEVALYGH